MESASQAVLSGKHQKLISLSSLIITYIIVTNIIIIIITNIITKIITNTAARNKRNMRCLLRKRNFNLHRLQASIRRQQKFA